MGVRFAGSDFAGIARDLDILKMSRIIFFFTSLKIVGYDRVFLCRRRRVPLRSQLIDYILPLRAYMFRANESELWRLTEPRWSTRISESSPNIYFIRLDWCTNLLLALSIIPRDWETPLADGSIEIKVLKLDSRSISSSEELSVCIHLRTSTRKIKIIMLQIHYYLRKYCQRPVHNIIYPHKKPTLFPCIKVYVRFQIHRAKSTRNKLGFSSRRCDILHTQPLFYPLAVLSLLLSRKIHAIRHRAACPRASRALSDEKFHCSPEDRYADEESCPPLYVYVSMYISV